MRVLPVASSGGRDIKTGYQQFKNHVNFVTIPNIYNSLIINGYNFSDPLRQAYI